MSDEQFKHVKALGLEIFWEGEYVRASDLEKLLEQAPVVYAKEYPEHQSDGWGDWCTYETENHDTHTALLVGVKPIERDSFEKLVRDLSNQGECTTESDSACLDRFIERAIKLMEAK